MRILLLADKLPYPELDGYGLRYAHYLRQLLQRHEVDIVTHAVGTLTQELESALGVVERIAIDSPPKASLAHRAVTALSPHSLHHRFPAFVTAIQRLVATRSYDAVWVGGWPLAQYMDLLGDLPILMDAADDEVTACRSYFERSRGAVERLQNYRSYLMHIRYQKRYFPLAHLCTFVADDDAEATRRRIPGLRVEVLANGVDTDQFAPTADFTPRPADPRPTLVFEGTMSFPPNEDGALFLAREVLPLVRRSVPDARVVLVGRDPGERVRALAGEGVEVTGTVDDVRPYLAAASVFVCPLLAGVGIKNKILQAWSMARPVVATSISTGGLAARHGVDLLIADGPEALAAACVDVLRDPQLAAELGAEGRRVALAQYSWVDRAARLEGWFQELTGQRRARGATRAQAHAAAREGNA